MKTILVIEDDTHLRSDLIDLLSLEGYEASGAENGHEGLLSVQNHQPDLIICDISMPELDGYGVIAALHEDPQTASIPLIFLSAHSEAASIDNGMRLGAVAHFSKPYDVDELLATIRAQLGN